MHPAVITGCVLFLGAVQPATRSVEVYEHASQTRQTITVRQRGDRLLIPMDVVTGPWGLAYKSLAANRVGICRDDVCIAFDIGDKPGSVLTIDEKQWVPAERLVSALRGRMLFDESAGVLLVDLTPRTRAAAVVAGGPVDFSLPRLSGGPFKLSQLRGRKVVIFAWASW